MAEHFDDWNLTCEYKKILVNTVDEHNDAFELLEMWLDNNFKKYKKAGLNFIYRQAENKEEIIEETEEIDIDSINEVNIADSEMDTDDCILYYEDKMNELIKAVKQISKQINNK